MEQCLYAAHKAFDPNTDKGLARRSILQQPHTHQIGLYSSGFRRDEMTTLACNFTGCLQKELQPETALVPAIKAIQQAEGGRPVTPATLASHVFCPEHAALGRGTTGGMFSYVETVKRLEQKAADRTAAKQFFAKYGEAPKKPVAPGKPAPRPNPGKNAMQLAFDRVKVA
jgi:hypothetical protein